MLTTPKLRHMNFLEKYKTYSNLDLYKIIVNPDDYQPIAVEAAKSIFEQRQIGQEELERIELEYQIQKQVEDTEKQKKVAVENKVKTFAIKLFDSINPFQRKAPTPTKLVNLIGAIFLGIATYSLIRNFDFIRFLLTTDGALEFLDISFIFFILSVLIVPVAGLLFILKKKIGWTLLVIHLIYSVVAGIASIITYFQFGEETNSLFLHIIPQISPNTFTFRLLFDLGVLIVICKKNIRDIFNVDKMYLITTLGVFGFLTVLFYYKFLF